MNTERIKHFLFFCTLCAVLSFLPSRAFADTDGRDCKKPGNYCFIFDGIPRVLRNQPKFSDYPAEKPLKGNRAKDIDWDSRRKAWSFRTRLRAGLKEPPNFNGHYRIVTIGCGSNCHVLWIIDLRTGKVAATRGLFPVYSMYKFNVDSSLIVISPPLPGDADMIDFGKIYMMEFAKLSKEGLETVSKVNIVEKMEPALPPGYCANESCE